MPERCKALEHFIEYYVLNFSYEDFLTHYALMYFHNLSYDWGQLIKNYPDMVVMAKTGVGLNEDYEIYKTNDYKVILRKKGLFIGSAPHFTIKVQMSKREWVDIMFRDTFSFFPASLAKLCKELGLGVDKLSRAEDLGRRDWRIEPPSEEKTYFETYSKIDALGTRLAAERIRELHINAGMKRIRVSSPGFAINYLYHNLDEGIKIKNGDDNKQVMQLVLDTYAGGRTGGIYHGRVENISVLDFHSSYPASMVSLPSFAPTMAYLEHPEPETITTDELLEIIAECHCFMRIDGEETDEQYPAVIKSIKGKLTPIFGKFENMATTGVELSVGLLSGTLTISKIRQLVCLVEMEEPEVLPFKEYAIGAYARKAVAPPGSAEYTGAKLVLNGGYGKLIESRNETTVDAEHRDIILPYVEDMDVQFGLMYYKEYVESLKEGERSFMDRYAELCQEVTINFDKDIIKYANFAKLSITKLEYGRYAIPAAASLITATSRARLLAVLKILRSIYWDTDSAFQIDLDPATLPSKLKTATAWLPPFILPLTFGDDLGELGSEILNASGYLAGTKRYYLQNDIYKKCRDRKACHKGEDDECSLIKKCKMKKALHGIPSAPYDIVGEMIESLATGQAYNYEGRARPMGFKESKTPEDIGRFMIRSYESQFHLDDRLEWKRNVEGWNGTVKENSTLCKLI